MADHATEKEKTVNDRGAGSHKHEEKFSKHEDKPHKHGEKYHKPEEKSPKPDHTSSPNEEHNRRKHNRTPTSSRRQMSPRSLDRRSRSSERQGQLSRRSSRKSHTDEGELHECGTKTDLIRASAKKAEEKRRLSSEHGDHQAGKTRHKTSSVSSYTHATKKSPKQTAANRRQSIAVIGYQRQNSHQTPSPKRSLSNSPNHKPLSVTGSKTSLLSKQLSATGSPVRTYAGLIEASHPGSAASRLLLPQSRASGYSKPAMEVAVAALVFGAGVVTLIVSLIIGSNAWMIVGAISMGIGGVFIAFGACFYISRHKPLLTTEEQVEVRIVDQKQLAELSNDGFKVRAVLDL